jgi:hypothetical protein
MLVGMVDWLNSYWFLVFSLGFIVCGLVFILVSEMVSEL